MRKYLRERTVGLLGSASGVSSILGSWQICHNICLGIIALLAVLGITITGMPLLFLTKIVVPLWSVAVVFLFVTYWLYYWKKCFSKNLLLINTGLVIAGTPSQIVSSLQPAFWAVGGIIASSGVVLYLNEKMKQRKRCHG